MALEKAREASAPVADPLWRGGGCGNGRFVGRHPLINSEESLRVLPAVESAASAGREGRKPAVEKAGDLGAHSLRLVVQQQSVYSIPNGHLGAAERSDQQRQADGGGFQRHQSVAFIIGWKDEGVGCGVILLDLVLNACEEHPLSPVGDFDVETRAQGVEPRGRAADDDQPKAMPACFSKPGKRIESEPETFPLIMPLADEDECRLRRAEPQRGARYIAIPRPNAGMEARFIVAVRKDFDFPSSRRPFPDVGGGGFRHREDFSNSGARPGEPFEEKVGKLDDKLDKLFGGTKPQFYLHRAPDRVDEVDRDEIRAEVGSASGVDNRRGPHARMEPPPSPVKVRDDDKPETLERPQPFRGGKEDVPHLVARRIRAQTPCLDLPAGIAQMRQRMQQMHRGRAAVLEVSVDPADRPDGVPGRMSARAKIIARRKAGRVIVHQKGASCITLKRYVSSEPPLLRPRQADPRQPKLPHAECEL